jgi:serine/threonine protein kinase/Flp pilus assembly protein TadD
MIGHVVSHYKIVEKLGAGGMGTVYKAEDTRLKRDVALKFLPENLSFDLEAKTRFMHEAQAASALDHPNICNIHEIDQTDNGQLFLCMTLYDGDTLKRKIQENSLAIDEVIKIAAQIATGLYRAHEAGIVHRDLKPANIMFTKDNDVKIVDFGLAKLSDQTDITKEGSPVGTIAYMSPEQTRGESVDLRTDIWAFGVILYEMLSGDRPFRGDYEQAVVYSILNENPVSIQNLRSDIPEELVQIVNRSLMKEPGDRFSSMKEIVSILQEMRSGSPSGTLTQDETQSPKQTKRLPQTITAIIILITLFLVIKYFIFAEPPIKYLAILPFTSIGPEERNQKFCEGLIEIMTSKLTQTEKLQGTLWIIPSSEVRKYRITSAGQAYKELNANLVITGSINERDDYIQLTLNLIDTESLRQLDSRDDKINIHNTSGIENKIFDQIVDMLELELKPAARAGLLAIGTQSLDARDFYLRGLGYLRQYEEERNIDTAIGLFGQALTRDSTYGLAHAGLGEAYWRKYMATRNIEFVKPAKANCQKALKYSNRDAGVYVTCGMIKNGIGEYEESEESLKKALEIDPVNAAAYWELGLSYLKRGEYELALSTFNKAVNVRPSYWQGYSHLGNFYLVTGQYEKAITPYKKVIEILPHSHLGYEKLAATYFYMNRFKEAVEYGEKSIARGASDTGYNNLAAYYYYAGQYEKAANIYRKVVASGTTDFRIIGSLATALYFTNREDSARIYYEKAVELAEQTLRINPNDVDVICMLAGYYAQLNDNEKAYARLNQAQSLEITNVDNYFDIGDVYEQLGERDLALEWIGKALENGFTLAKIENNPGLNELRKDKRFQDLVKKYN